MDFLLVYPEGAEVGEYPYFGVSVNEAGLRAARSLEPARLFVVSGGPEGGADDGERVSAEQAVAEIGQLGEQARGVILPAGLVEPPVEILDDLIEAAGEAPMQYENEFGQVIAIAGSAEALGAGLQDTFGGCLEMLSPEPFAEDEPGASIRIECAGSWSAAVRDAQWRTAERFQSDGALIEEPETLWADPACKVAPGARIAPSVRLIGATRIGEGAEVGSFCRIENSEVLPGAAVLSHSVVVNSIVGRGARVGPFAHVRPNTRLEPGAFAGSFVETKNVVLGRNAALPHLSYLGDAEIGARANLGAGTITCNYDGKSKHRTVVEPGAFVGSNACLVAPVTVGRRSFVAAGSVIVEDVPENALAIARGRQAVKPDRAAGRYERADEV